jgi:DNA replication and repair protein RecF
MITEIRLQHFRSYTDDSFDFAPGVNIIVGPNASGKTNLLEAVLLIAHGTSYRAKDAELVEFGAPWARVEAHTQVGSRVVKLEPQMDIVKKAFEIDEQPYQRLSLQKTLPTVVFEPNHLLLLTGSPELRRTYADDLIEQLLPGYGATRRHYKRALSQRNALLKKGFAVASQQVFVWNLRLSELGGKIATERLKLIDTINADATTMYRDLSHTNASVQLVYKTTCAQKQYETSLLHHLEANLEKDCLIGYTSVGPHRDDITIMLDGRYAETTASRGETRTLVLMLKIVALQTLEKVRGITPLLLLDDVFSELDGSRRQALTTHLQPYQTFITTTDADVVVRHFTENAQIIPINVNAAK